MNSQPVPVAMLGLGPMGRALAGAFLAAGHATTVWNRTPGRADELLAHGAKPASTAAEAVAASRLVVVCVINYDAVHQILDPIAAQLRGKTVVNLTADTPDRARAAAEWARDHGIDYLDGSIMTPVVSIGQPEAVLLYSGPAAVYEAYQPVLAALGGTGTYLGVDPGRAAAYDVALLDIFWTAMSGVVHAFALARAEQVGAQELAPFAEGILGVTGQVLHDLAKEADERRYPGDDSTLDSNVASMAHIIHAAHHRGIDTSVLSAAKAIADRAVQEGHGQGSFTRLVELLGRGGPELGTEPGQ